MDNPEKLAPLDTLQGTDPGFQIRGAHLKILRRAEGGAKNFGVFRVKNHDFTPKNHIFSNFRGGRAPGAPPPGSAPALDKGQRQTKPKQKTKKRNTDPTKNPGSYQVLARG